MTSRALPRIRAFRPKPPGVAAEVEHGPAGTEPGDLAAVVALIAEEARLVPLFKVDAVADSMLGDGHAGRKLRAGQGPARKVFLLRDPLVDGHAKMGGPQPFGDQREDRADPLIHAQAEDLDREDVVVPVDDQAGESVSLGVDDTVGVGLAVEPEDLGPQRDRFIDAVGPELGARRLALAATGTAG